MSAQKTSYAAAPLLTGGQIHSQTSDKGKTIVDDNEETDPMYVMQNRRSTSLVWTDALIVILEVLQLLALLQAMSLRWIWPQTWVQNLNFILLFNLDIWEFLKISSGAYVQVQSSSTPSASIPVNFNFIILGWAVLLILIFLILGSIYAILSYRKRPYLLIHRCRMEKALIIIAQLVALPIGTVIFRLFHCNSSGQVDVLNELYCYKDVHWAYVVLGLVIAFASFVIYPGYLIYRIHGEVLLSRSSRYENYLQLKEMEYLSGLDVVWVIRGFHIFSSFKSRSVYFRPLFHIFKLLLLIVYASSFGNVFVQATVTSVFLFILWIHHIVLRPFRINSFNVVLIFSYLCLLGDATLGAAIASSSPSSVQSPWLVEPYALWIMVGVNGILLLVIIVFVLHLIIYGHCCHRKLKKAPMWPTLTSQGSDSTTTESKKFMRAVLRGRAFLEQCRTVQPLFAPVHELSQHIELVNAYYREAEMLGDPLHNTLWNLLDEMIIAHEELEPQSLFADCVKKSVRQTATQLMELLPAFSQRLAQRDYDFILVDPVRKRMLLKMYILGMFLNGRSQEVHKENLNKPALTQVWPHLSVNEELEEQSDYIEELYPDPLEGPDNEFLFEATGTGQCLQLLDIDDDSETESLSSALKKVPELLTITLVQERVMSQQSLSSKRSKSSADLQGHDENEENIPGTVVTETQGHTIERKPSSLNLEGAETGETSTDDPHPKDKLDAGKKASTDSSSVASRSSHSSKSTSSASSKSGSGSAKKKTKKHHGKR